MTKIVTSVERLVISPEIVRIMPIIPVVETPSIPAHAIIVVALVIYHAIAKTVVVVVVVEIVTGILIVIGVARMGTWLGIVNPRMKSVTTAVKVVT